MKRKRAFPYNLLAAILEDSELPEEIDAILDAVNE